MEQQYWLITWNIDGMKPRNSVTEKSPTDWLINMRRTYYYPSFIILLFALQITKEEYERLVPVVR